MIKPAIRTPALLAWVLAAQTGHCFYNPSGGRWLSRDPLGEDGGKNVYAFVGNNPVLSVDHDGRQFDQLRDPGPKGNGLFTRAGCCNGQQYSLREYCCCNYGKVVRDGSGISCFQVKRKEVDSGVKQWKWKNSKGNPNNPGGEPDMHVWLTWPGDPGSVDANAINSSGPGGNPVIGGGYVSAPAAAMIPLHLDEDRTSVSRPIMLSPCQYDFNRLYRCLDGKATAAAKTFFLKGNCQAFMDQILSDCMNESKGCTGYVLPVPEGPKG
jgi:uncharacterized protein RhaS with RHS repeats